MIKDELKGVLYLDNGVICRRPGIRMIKTSKFEEFKYMLLTNENLTNENTNIWDKKWKGHGFLDLDDDERVNCICSQPIKNIYYIINITSGNIYQVGCDCVEKNISKILADDLRNNKKAVKKRKIEIEKDIQSSNIEIERIKNEFKTYKNKVNDFICDYYIFNGFGKYRGISYTTKQIVDGDYRDDKHSWITLGKIREDAIKSDFKYIHYPEIKDFLKSGLSTPQEYLSYTDLFPINISIPHCNCGAMRLKRKDDRDSYYCVNWNNQRKCQISYINSYLKHPYIPFGIHPLRYLQQVLDTEITKILELQRELEGLNKITF
jgi:hypothetical protein